MDTTDTGRAATDMTADTLVTADQAARLAGVSARTVRRWAQRGLLASLASEGGQLVSPADLPAAKAAAGGGHGPGRGHGHVHDRADTATVTDTPPGAVSPAARSQLEAIRDEWLAPLVAQIREQAEEIGGLRAERDALAADRARLAAEAARDRGLADDLVDLLQDERDAARAVVERLRGDRDTAHDAPAPPGATAPPATDKEPRAGLWGVWDRLAGRG